MSFDIPDEEKKRRLDEIITLQREISYSINKKMVGKTKRVLVETLSKKSDDYFMGRTDCNKSVILPTKFISDEVNRDSNLKAPAIGDMIDVLITKANSATLFGNPVHFHLPISNSLPNG